MRAALVLITGPGFGGAERRFFRLFNKISETRDDLYLITNKGAFLTAKQRGFVDDRKNISYIADNKPAKGFLQLRPIAKIISVARTFYQIFQIRQVVKKKKIAHMHFLVNPGYISYAFSSFALIFGVTTSVTVVESTKTDKKSFTEREWKHWSKTLKIVKAIEVLSPGIYRDLLAVFGEEVAGKVKIAPCSFTDYTRAKPGGERTIDICFASRLVVNKGLDLLFDSLELIEARLEKDYGKKLKVNICGSGPSQQYAEARAARINNMDIDLHYEDDLFQVFSNTKIFLSLQKKENYPSQSLLEAMASEAAVVVTDVGDSKLMVPDGSGYLVSENASDVANAVIELLNNPEKRRHFAKNARRFVLKEHSIEKYTEHFSKFIDYQLNH